MADIVIVTNQCYLIAEAINYIKITEADEEAREENLFYDPPRKRRRRKKSSMKQKLLDKLKRAAQLYQIHIDFVPVPNVNNGNGSNNHRRSDGSTTVTINVRGYDRCKELFQEMITQIRDQQPDKLHLEKLVAKFLTDQEELDKESQ